jgi:GT2 family glycosyltransferase
VVFIILHYQALIDTEECVNSILKYINYNNYKIIIVDNCSPNKSGEILKNKYLDQSKVHVILNSDNMGFARGNNVGYHLAKNKYKADFIVMINNDTIINDSNFINKIINKYNNNKYGILGPDIISLVDNNHQNPIRKNGMSFSEVQERIKKFQILKILNKFKIDSLGRKVFCKIKGNKVLVINNNYSMEQEDVVLHGSSLIFSPDYINKYDGLHDETFMFWEEFILYYIAKRDKIKILYTPDLKIYHKEDSSTNLVLPNQHKKNKFFYENSISSLLKLRNIMNYDKNI